MKKLLVLIFALSAFGCRTEAPFIWVDDLPTTERRRGLDQLRPGDRIQVQVWSQRDLTLEVAVRGDGNITMPLIGDVSVAGLTLPKAAEAVAKRLTKEGIVVDPRVSVILRSDRQDTISILGEVRNAGQFDLKPTDNLLNVLARAGGLTPFANPKRVFVVRQHGDQTQRVRFDYQRLSSALGSGLDFPLEDGDVVVVE